MSQKNKVFCWLGLIFLCVFFLCWPFFNSPIFFDDQYLFLSGAPEKHLANGVRFHTRWWVYESLVATYFFLGPEFIWLRVGNFFLHFLAMVSLFLLLRSMLRDLDRGNDLVVSVDVASLSAAALFVLHPLSIFTEGYLIQRTIICATLFSFLTLFLFWRGLSGSRYSLWFSCFFYAIAVYSKEHAVMLPFVSFLAFLLFWRSGLILGLSLWEVFSALFLKLCVALLVVFQLKGIIGVPYEILTQEMLEGGDIPSDWLYPLSVLNQAGLFFKYLGLWFFPFLDSVSVDIRSAFPLDFSGLRIYFMGGAFCVYLLGSFALLLLGRSKGLLGFCLLAPGVLFFTEFAAVRLQEPFVIYRSYLWGGFLFIGVSLGLRRLSFSYLMVLILPILLAFTAFSFQRLKTFSHPVLLWSEAAQVYEKNSQSSGVFGGYRIYYNLGSELRRFGYLELSLEALNKSLQMKPDYGYSLNNRGAVFLDMSKYALAQADYERAVQLLPRNVASWNGLARALELQGDYVGAEKARQVVCVLRMLPNCFGSHDTSL